MEGPNGWQVHALCCDPGHLSALATNLTLIFMESSPYSIYRANHARPGALLRL